jgi:hypothetical protein
MSRRYVSNTAAARRSLRCSTRPAPSVAGTGTIKVINSFQDLGPAIYATIPSEEAIQAGREFGRRWVAMALRD